ncbi:FAD-binding domain [Ornithinimicrobium avium]|uniref:FAD-binding domain n=1 Tax=Ornithinimicrobium avium TaxID=2283195 RepID=A0A345NL28_9MICO|nr:FAD-binding domain [Ornithinimicrobium avium]AXH95736.1 FAD-binding domain [Ornithinimicrobium avium]
MRVAINGVGVAGPALAYWLRRSGHEPVLFERAPALRTGGYVIDFWGRGYELADRMGVLPELRERGYLVEELRTVDATGRTRASIDLRPMREALGERFLSARRSDLSAMVLAACGDVVTHFGVWVEDLAQDAGGVDVTLSDGRTDRFDLVVGADGLHSHVRSLAFGPAEQFEKPLGAVVAAVRMEDYPHRDELVYVLHTVPRRQASRFSMRDGETLSLLICRDDVAGPDAFGRPSAPEPTPAEQRAALRHAFAGMGWETPEILARLETAEDFYCDRVSQIHLPSWSTGRVALVGDAAACASLLAGEGTGLAMIEAYVLAGELARHVDDIPAGLRAYEDRLRDFVTTKQRSALRMLGFFAPSDALALAVQELGVRIASVPFVTRLAARRVGDDVELPRYEAGG